ncbi:MAG: hypothetical protein QGI51_04675 [Dehalococcoidales bacterium]|jgi:hypothetical protein|nr:hypothetical protein [Dehalococcoidales bacterium]
MFSLQSRFYEPRLHGKELADFYPENYGPFAIPENWNGKGTRGSDALRWRIATAIRRSGQGFPRDGSGGVRGSVLWSWQKIPFPIEAMAGFWT